MVVKLSKRTCWDLAEEPLATALFQVRREGGQVHDLTVSNPTLCGFDYSVLNLLAPLSDAAGLIYHPLPLGMPRARQAICSYYKDHSSDVCEEQVLLTTSTSEAYSFLFRLLCDPGDEVLVAQPSYPLFDFVATLDGVQLRPFPLFYDFGWWIDFARLEHAVTPRTRAILLVHPNNPTGHPTLRAERDRLEFFCAEHELALVVDEVFLDYGLGERIESFAQGPHPCLKFIVSGISKVMALPQMKVGWIATFGPASDRLGALSRLEVIADTFLSMNGPIQQALPVWMERRELIQRQIVERVSKNLVVLASSCCVSVLPVIAGWCAVVALPQSLQSTQMAERILKEAGVLVHPGYFYGLAARNQIVVSLLGSSSPFREATSLLDGWCESNKLTIPGST